jgi:hypothetical protein
MSWNWADVTSQNNITKPWNWADVSRGQPAPGTGREASMQNVAALLGGTSPAQAPSLPTRGAAMGGPSQLIPRGLERAGRMGGANALQGLMAPQVPQGFMGMSDAELLQFLLGGGGGGGGVDLSGYNEMLSDVAGREASLGTRRGEQEAFLSDLFSAAQGRMTTDREALAAAVQSQLESDAARRAQEVGLVRGADAERLATANQARAALGVEGGADLSSDIAQNAVAGIGAGGSVAERDARIRESIQNQQIQSQLAGLVPMEQMARSDLGRGYEDRLSTLAGERAAIKAQMAQARSAARGGGGPSVNEKLAALGFVSGLNAPAAAPQFGGALGSAQEIQQWFGPSGGDVLGIANRILTGADLSRFDPTSLAGASELLTRLATSDPAVQNFLNRNPEAPGAIIQYIVQSSK